MNAELQATTRTTFDASRLDESDEESEEFELNPSVNVEVTMDYDINFPPPKPGPEWTRFICIGDTHGTRFRVPPGDVLLHAGDLTRKGKVSELRSTIDWLASLRHPYKIVIAGNHDRALDPSMSSRISEPSPELDYAAAFGLMTSPETRASNIHYLNCEIFEIPSVDGRRSWTVYGSPWTPWFRGLSFNYKETMAQEIADNIPADADVVMTHGPPYGVLDLTRKEGVHAGCPTLLSRIADLKPRLHIFGHIHESRGSRVQQWENDNKMSQSTVFLNAANSPLTSTFGPETKSTDGRRIPIGGVGWRPIIVDML